MSSHNLRFFLTAEDPRELPKGSRDPLRFIPVWSTTGRRLIPYLTTVTPSYRGFLTRFLFHGALELYGMPLSAASADDQWDAFCRFEQLCAVVRTELEPQTPWLPGSKRVRGRLIDREVQVSSHSSDWLGKSQKTTGYWGYYHQACLGSGILEPNQADQPGYVLTEDARSVLNGSWIKTLLLDLREQLEPVLRQPKVSVPIDHFAPLANRFYQKPATEPLLGPFWIDHILIPDQHKPGGELRAAFAARLRDVVARSNEQDTGAIWEELASPEQADAVTAEARNVRATEAIIGLSEWVFDVCRLMHEDTPSLHLARYCAMSHGYDWQWLRRLRDIQPPNDPELQELRRIALHDDDSFIPFARALLDRHRRVMRGRGGAPWVSCEEDDTLTVRQPATASPQPVLESYPNGVQWRYDYFLDSWLTAAREIGYLPGSSDHA